MGEKGRWEEPRNCSSCLGLLRVPPALGAAAFCVVVVITQEGSGKHPLPQPACPLLCSPALHDYPEANRPQASPPTASSGRLLEGGWASGLRFRRERPGLPNHWHLRRSRSPRQTAGGLLRSRGPRALVSDLRPGFWGSFPAPLPPTAPLGQMSPANRVLFSAEPQVTPELTRTFLRSLRAFAFTARSPHSAPNSRSGASPP